MVQWPMGQMVKRSSEGPWANSSLRCPTFLLERLRPGSGSSGSGGARERAMQALARTARGLWPPAAAVTGSGYYGKVQASRGIVVQVRDGNLERALQVMERKMRSSGIERLIKRRTEHHVKNSEKRVLAHKALMARVRSQELGKKLREILIKKIRGQ